MPACFAGDGVAGSGRLDWWVFAAHQERNDEEDDEDEEENLRESNGGSGDAAEAEHGGDECDDEEGNGPVNHKVKSFEVVDGCSDLLLMNRGEPAACA